MSQTRIGVKQQRAAAARPAMPARTRRLSAMRQASSGGGAELPQLLLAAALHRGGDAQRLAVLRDRAARDVDAVLLEDLDDLLVGEHVVDRLAVDQRLDAEAHRLGGM